MTRFLDEGTFRLSAEEFELIQQNALVKSYKRGEILLRETERADGLYIIKAGYVKVFRESENGREKILAILTGGDVLGEMGMFRPHLRSASAKALEATVAWFLPHSKFEEFLRKIPAFGLRITEILTERLRDANKQNAQLVNCNSSEKVLYQLFDVAKAHGRPHKKGTIIHPRLTHHDFASLAGVARETVTKVFNELKEEGLITLEHRRVIVRDLEGLEARIRPEG